VEIDDLYQDIILDHYKHPRHSRRLAEGEAMVDEENPTCGDHIKLSATVADGRVADVVMDCVGCAICTASTSIMTEMTIGRPVAEVRALAARFTALMRGQGTMTDEELGDLVALRGVAQYPLRVKCATMGWHALDAALAPRSV
jgi:nitrogen fixation NifU-like protein